jgi:hypothetical protein
VTRNAAPQFTVTATSAYSTSSVYNGLGVTDPPPTALYYWVDDGSAVPGHTAQWAVASETAATVGQNPGVFTLAVADQSIGLHTLYYFSAYGDEGVSANTDRGSGSSPSISNLQQIVYEVLPATSTMALTADVNPQSNGGSVTFTATIVPGTGRVANPTGTVYFYDGLTLLGSVPLASSGGSYTAAYATTVLTVGNHSISALYGGDGNYASSSNSMAENIAGAAASITVVSGSGQTAPVGTAFRNPIVVLVTDASTPAIPVPGVTVTFASTGMSFNSSGVASTDSNGNASITATPTTAGAHLSATATATGVSSAANFTETATTVTPTVTAWPTASAIAYGQTLASSNLIWSDPVNACTSVGLFLSLLLLLLFFEGRASSSRGRFERRLISLIFACRSRIIMIRRELPLTKSASPAEPVA